MAATVPAPGALVLAIGAEEGAPTASLGLVSVSRGPWQSMRGGEMDASVELDARLRSTAEGGLAVDATGQAFGMTVFGPRRRVLVIPSVTIGRIAARLEAHGRIPRGYLGLGLQAVTIEGGGSGVMVMSVDPNGPRSGGQYSSGRCDGELGRQADRQAAAVVAIAGTRQRWKTAGDRVAARRAIAPDKATNRRKASGLKDSHSRDRLRLAIDVDDPALADRIVSALADIEGLELVGKDDEPDALVVAALGAATEPDAHIALTARELEVLALLAEGASNKLIARRLGISSSHGQVSCRIIVGEV